MIQQYLRQLVIGLVLLKLFLEGHTPREWAVFSAVLLLSHVNMQLCNERQLFWALLFMVGSKDIDIKRFAVTLLVPIVALTVLVIVLNRLGLSDGIVGVRHGSGRIRPSLGFKNPNSLGMSCYIISSILAVLWWRHRPMAHLAATIALLVPMWLIADCRSALVSTVLLSIVVQVFSHSERLCTSKTAQTVTAICCLLVFVGCFLASLSWVYVFGKPSGLLAKVDYLLSFRISLAQAYYDLYSPTLLGQNIGSFPVVTVDAGISFTNKFLVDNGYLRLLMHDGILACAVYFGGLLALFVKAIREHHVNACLIVMSVGLVYGLVEWHPLMMVANVFVIAVGTLYHGTPVSSLDMPAERASVPVADKPLGRHFSD